MRWLHFIPTDHPLEPRTGLIIERGGGTGKRWQAIHLVLTRNSAQRDDFQQDYNRYTLYGAKFFRWCRFSILFDFQRGRSPIVGTEQSRVVHYPSTKETIDP